MDADALAKAHSDKAVYAARIKASIHPNDPSIQRIYLEAEHFRAEHFRKERTRALQ
jgi:hypothetical protein